MRHRIALLGAGAVLLLGSLSAASPAAASVSSIAIYPTYQSTTPYSTVSWGWSWGGTGTYQPVFHYGDGYSRTYGSQANGGSGSASHYFTTCITRTYTQQIQVNTSYATGQTRVDASHGCLAG